MTIATQPLPQWDRLSWDARRRAASTLARIERRLTEDIRTKRAELTQIEASIARAKGELAQSLDCLDLRLSAGQARIIWGDDALWSRDELRAAHAAHARTPANLRDEWTRVGERIYQKQRNRRVRCDCGGQKRPGSARCDWCYRSERAS